MTEAKWLTCTNPKAMLVFLEARASDRQVRLFVCAAARRVWEKLAPALQRNLEASEAYAEGELTLAELKRAWGMPEETTSSLLAAAHHGIGPAAEYARCAATYPATPRRRSPRLDRALQEKEWAVQAELLRCIFGNPFRPVLLDPLWLKWSGGIIPALASAIHAERAFERLPILADALEEAGCTEEAILTHLRSPGPHTRGCWPIDLLLGKK